ncbi:hypothetical protein DSO57_1024479 [Entomophthora muscae]|uniref:Uncharacterized protein n=1 Tax=Entomophthora muscae TaxID=34485 RepID=A0ACC2TPN3_9FUNG|nr:hypothetical protein DSO57_1024479 [Entomophthora muscae]
MARGKYRCINADMEASRSSTKSQGRQEEADHKSKDNGEEGSKEVFLPRNSEDRFQLLPGFPSKQGMFPANLILQPWSI